MSKASRLREMNETLQRLSKEPIVSALVRRDDVLEVMGRLDEPYPRHLWYLIGSYLRTCFKAKRGKGPLCLGCETEFVRHGPWPVGFWLIHAHGIEWTASRDAVVTGICSRCEQKNDTDLSAVGLAHMKRIWPNITTRPYPVPPTSTRQ
jgi:hypothetical protein